MNLRITRTPIHEQGSLVVGTYTVDYDMRTHPRARAIKMTIRPDGVVRITLPPRASRAQGLEFVMRRRMWVGEVLSRTSTITRIPLPSDAPSRRYYVNARRIVESRIEVYNGYYQCEFGSIRIKDMTTKWGSCSSKGNLNFNYKLQFLPPHLIDYIVVHEVCHLKEMNHSSRFWALVSQCIPDYSSRKKELRFLSVH